MSSVDRRADRAAQIQAQVAYHRQRLELHRRLHGSGGSMRLAELENAYASARRRLEGATASTPTEGAGRAARNEGEA